MPVTTTVDAAWLRRFRTAVKRWYPGHARDLPWRRTTDPYRIWISEIMLQQTTVVAVVPYFERFLSRFPTLAELAAAEEQEVLRYWEGLGYYSRARNIHWAARVIVAEQAGTFPRDLAGLQDLPGIGRYTAGAIASFAYDLPAPIVEANTLRLYARLLGYRADPRARAGQILLWDFAEQIVPKQAAGAFNQALMELGATVCTPTSPACPECPVKSCCAAFAAGLQHEIPLPQRRPEPTAVTEFTVAIRQANRYLLYRRQAPERWAGLWDFPRFAWDDAVPAANAATWLAARLHERFGVRAEVGDQLAEIRHSVTRYRITLRCMAAEHVFGSAESVPGDLHWATAAEFADYPLSATGRRFARILAARLDQ